MSEQKDRYKVDDLVPPFDISCEIKVLMLPMRDGVKLHTAVYLPPGLTGRAPVLMIRTPYTRTTQFELPSAAALAHRTVFIVQACRGTGWSEGEFFPAREESEISDAEDTFRWLAEQPFFDGRCAMMGGSYPGWVQYCAAFNGNEILKAIAPHVAPIYSCRGALRPGGGNFLGFTLVWNFTMHHRRRYGFSSVPDYRAMKISHHLPVMEADLAAGYGELPAVRKFLGIDDPDRFFGRNDEKFRNVRAPAFISAGWFDDFKDEAFDAFRRLRKEGATEKVRRFTRLTVGPWGHCAPVNPEYFGADNGLEALNGKRDDFLFGLLAAPEDDPLPGYPAVRCFMAGDNRWMDFPDWPPPDVSERRFFLHSGGNANGANGDGELTEIPPDAAEPADHYVSDPTDPVPDYLGGEHEPQGYFDHRADLIRNDLLVYTSPALTRPRRIAGEVTMSFCASVSAPDTDFFVLLSDVLPDGRSMVMARGMVRGRFRDWTPFPPPRGETTGKLLTPGEVYHFTVHLGNCAVNFLPGHRMRVTICGQNFPAFERNAQSGEKAFHDKQLHRASCTVCHDAAHPAFLTLPEL